MYKYDDVIDYSIIFSWIKISNALYPANLQERHMKDFHLKAQISLIFFAPELCSRRK